MKFGGKTRLLRIFRHLAEKSHWCDRCCRFIEAGEMYEGMVYVSNHGITVFKVHIEPPCEYPPDPDEPDNKSEKLHFDLAA